MIRLANLIFEEERNRIKGKVKVTYIDSSSVMDVAEILRAIEDVTIVDTGGGDAERLESIYEVKFLTTKDPKSVFTFFKQKALQAPEIVKLLIAPRSIEYF